MAKRHNRIFTLVNRRTNGNAGPWGFQIGHPCGFMATSRHLAARPSLSKAVGDYLLNDASMSGDFECMLSMMVAYDLKVSKHVKLHLAQWHKLGCPTHKKNEALSRALHRLYTTGFPGVSTYYQVRDTAAKFWAATNEPSLPVDADGEPVVNFDQNGKLILV